MGNGWDVNIGDAQDFRTYPQVEIGDAQITGYGDQGDDELDPGLWDLIMQLFGGEQSQEPDVFVNGRPLGMDETVDIGNGQSASRYREGDMPTTRLRR